jgi:hypothetical protein
MWNQIISYVILRLCTQQTCLCYEVSYPEWWLDHREGRGWFSPECLLGKALRRHISISSRFAIPVHRIEVVAMVWKGMPPALSDMRPFDSSAAMGATKQGKMTRVTEPTSH